MSSERKSKIKRAVALEYDGRGECAPSIAAKAGYDDAELLVKIAKRYNIPVVERAPLAQALEGLEVDTEIPEKLFEAVAIVLNEIERKETGKG